MSYTIRTAVPADEEKIRGLFLEMLRTIYRTDDAEGYGEGDLDRFWCGNQDRIYVAEDGPVIAFLSVEVHHDPVDHIYLDDFSVTAAYRNKGIGSTLIRAAEEYAGQIGSKAVILHVEKQNTSAMRFYERYGYSVFRDDGNRFLLKKDIVNAFCEALREGNTAKLLEIPKSDLHNHSTKGCRREWLAERLKRSLADPPVPLNGLAGMQEWFRSSLKPFCDGTEGFLLRWEGAFAEAKRNHIARLSMNFGPAEIDEAGGPEVFRELIEGFQRAYCPDTVFEPELTYPSTCDIDLEAERMDGYLQSCWFRSIDICGFENYQPVEAFLPLYRKAERYGLVKKMHAGEAGTADDVRRAVEVLGLSEVHHGIGAATSKETMRFLADNRIQLNVCPSSNVMLGYVKDYRNHPIRVLVENGVRVTINTDDLLIFDSSIENEYLKLYNAGTLSAEQLDDIRRAGLAKDSE
ncbi:MAG: GNAT family N-acetyltransferase [Clostridia bacterium]|nr:GNAT family N-acetyltransferase [Clostridia bacterium]